jgi:hypothetical protein
MRKRYPSDLTDAQWARIAPIFESSGRGRPRQVSAREILNAIFYVLKNGCAGRELLKRLKGPGNSGLMLADLHLQTASIGTASSRRSSSSAALLLPNEKSQRERWRE